MDNTINQVTSSYSVSVDKMNIGCYKCMGTGWKDQKENKKCKKCSGTKILNRTKKT